jgi:hypothetical protein
MIFEGIRRAVLSPSFLNEDMRTHLDSAFERVAAVCILAVCVLYVCVCLSDDYLSSFVRHTLRTVVQILCR